MAQTKLYGRQWPRDFDAAVGVKNAGVGNETLIDLAPNDLLKSIFAFVTTPFDGTGTVTITVSDGTNTFIAAQTVKAAGVVTVAVTTPVFYPAGGTLTVSIADQNSNSVNGNVLVYGSTINSNRQNEVQE